MMLYDYHHGHEFFGPDGDTVKERIFDVIGKDNVEYFLNKFASRDWTKIDFRKFTKTQNSSLKKYDFLSKH